MSKHSHLARRGRWVVLLAVLSFGCSEGTQTVYVPSLTALLARPNDLNGDTVVTFGYLYAGGNLALYLTKDHAVFGDATSKVFVVLPVNSVENPSACLNSYVYVEGRFVFDAETRPSLMNIKRISSVVNRECDWGPISGTDVDPRAE